MALKTRALKTRAAETTALMMIGDGVVGVLMPRKHVNRWTRGPSWWRSLAKTFAERPAATRALSVGSVVAGMWWASRLPGHRQ